MVITLMFSIFLFLVFKAPFSGDIPSTSWADALRSTIEFGLVSLSIDMGHIWSWNAYSYKEGYVGVTSLFYRSFGPYI